VTTGAVTGRDADDPFAAVCRLADAVLYEGYVLYPYRASAAKNRNRWQFGVLVPPAAGAAHASSASCEFLVDGPHTELRLLVRFLQVQARVVEVPAGEGGGYRPVPSACAGERVWTTWDEAVEREVDLGWVPLTTLAGSGGGAPVSLAGDHDTEQLVDDEGRPVGRLVRRCWPLVGAVTVTAAPCEAPCPLTRMRVEVRNDTVWDGPEAGWDETTRRSLLSVHLLVAARGGRFVSSQDPPAFASAAAAACVNRGLYPVLVGDRGADPGADPGADDLLLAAPIILYDHPELAPESQGDSFDATEIDEILTLRVLTLTDEEKAEARATDPRAAAVVDRCDGMPEEVLARLHGAIRSLRPLGADVGRCQPGGPGLPWWDPGVDAAFDPRTDVVLVDGSVVGAGAKVRLSPSRRADAQDMFVAGRSATVTGVYHDVDGDVHVAVVVDDDDDQGAALHDWYGRYLYFRPDELDVPDEAAPS